MTGTRLALSAALLSLLAACGNPVDAGTTPAAADGTAVEPPTGAPLVIGSVSDDPGEEAEVFQPFIDHVAAELAGEGIARGEVVVTDTVEEMSDLLRAGDVDLYVDDVYGTTTVVEEGVALPILRRWKDGAPTYHSIIVSRRDSGISSIAQLPGRTVAFEEETSADGYFLAAATLREQGQRLTPVTEPGSPVASDELGYVFSGDDENTIFFILDGRVDAGAMSAEDLAENAGARAAELAVIGRSIEVPRHVVVVRTDLAPALRQALVELLTTLHEADGGRQVLDDFDGTARFDPLTRDGLAPVLRLREVLGASAP